VAGLGSPSVQTSRPDFRSLRRVPAVYGLSMGQDHLMPGLMPAPILREITAWFKIHLSNDEVAKEVFYGDKCAICDDPAWQVKRKNL
jgi:hypothetical protein